jgi:hypothetical protein
MVLSASLGGGSGVDFFGRKARKQNEQLALYTAKALDKKDKELANRQFQLYQYALKLGEYEQALGELHLEIQRLNDELRRAGEQNRRPEPVPQRAVLDDEDEIRWQAENGLIDSTQAQQLLKELAFENAEVDIAPEYLRRADFTY